MKAPLVIIGAGRSGTNALRDALTSIEAYSTWPCDEINYIWRAGNRSRTDDELRRADANERARTVIRGAFERQAAKHPSTRLVEKTCANSLRVEFVDEVVPEALFLHILRDGRDVTSSAMSRWTASLDLRYIARKARYVPRRDLPFYATRYVRSRLFRRRSGDARVSTWGPRFDGLDELVQADAPLDVICAEQWARCVTAAHGQLAQVDRARQLTVHYDDFVQRPAEVLGRIVEFGGDDVPPAAIEAAAGTIHSASADAWKQRLSAEQIERITPIVEPVHRLVEAAR